MKNKRPDVRPIYLNLFRIRQPVTAITSIAHRISGILLFLAIPFMIWMLEHSLQGPGSYQQIVELYQQPLMKGVIVVLAWALAHHFFAGIRFLLLDIDWGIGLTAARRSAMLVNVLGIAAVTAVVMVLL